MAALSIVLPHKRNEGNDKSVRVALECLYTNTVSEFILLSDAAYDSPLYERVNRLIELAPTDCVVFTCSDMFMARGWDTPMLEAWTPDTIVTNVLVEPGVMGIHPNNIERDFGRRPETFRRAEFEDWAATTTQVPDGEGWLAPYMISRSRFLEMGGLRTDLAGDAQGFTPADQVFFEAWKAIGRRVVRAKSYTYHIQRYSELSEQEKSTRNT